MERESFVFHREFIEDLPEAYQQKFVSYAIQYGIYGIEPDIDEASLEYTVWLKTKRRIDEDCERYQRACENRERRNEARRLKYQAEKGEGTNGDDADAEPSPKLDVEPSEPSKPRKRFRKPTVDEVAEYCRERGNTIDAQTFVDYYETNGWTIGKGGKKMQNWKAAVRTWENRRRTEEAARPQPSLIGHEKGISAELAAVFDRPVTN